MFRYFALSLLIALAAAGANAADAGTVEGKMTVEGKSRTFTNAYAMAVKADRGKMFYKVLLSDVPLTDKQLGLFPDVVIKEINAGQIHVLRIGIDDDGSVDAVDIYDGENWPTIKQPNKLDLKTFDTKTIAGRLHIDKPYKDMTGTYQYDVKFSIPIRPESEFLQ